MRRRDILAGAGAAAVLAGASRRAVAEAVAGSVVGVAGACFVERPSGAVPLRLGDTVAVTDTIDVPAGGRLKLRMNDGSIIAVASGTKLTITAYQTDAAGHRQDARLSLAQGLIRAVVAQVGRPTQFEVSTAVGVSSVRSTDWFIEAKPGSTQVGVLSGAVVLRSNATGRAVEIPTGWGARVDAGRDPVEPHAWAPQEFQAVITRTDVP
ncbi:MAG TPA: FecR family protein [Stellaceae bacterium]|jgi:hypothetical protein